MTANWKDRSETIKNLVSTAAVVVGGIWVLYQWDTVFPKTRADIQTAAAAVRTDVSGTFVVKLGIDEGGGPPPFQLPGSTGAQSDLVAYCASTPQAKLMQTTPVFGQLTLKSASAIPVRARVERIRVATAPIIAGEIKPATIEQGAIITVPTTPVAAIDDEAMFFGGLRENRLEKDQEVEVAMMFNAQIPVDCAHLDRLALFQAEVALTAIDPAKDQPIGSPVPKVFVTTCQLNPRSAPACNVKAIEARGE